MATPDVLQIPALDPNNWEPRLERHIEARRADEHIKLMLLSASHTPLLGNTVNLTNDNLHIIFLQRLEVSLTRRHATAAKRPLGDQLLLETRVQQLLHLVGDVLLGLGLQCAAVEEQREDVVDVGLGFFAP
jgi:hypothetical protein